MENAVMVQENRGIQSYSVNQVKAQVAQVQELMKGMMQEGTHYGKSFPNDTKKNLLKPGADKLMFMFRLRPDFEQEIKELANGHREIITHCKVYHIESGNKIAEGVGSASTLESKFRYRNTGRKCPECGKETIKESKYDGGGFYCYAKIGGCGAKFDKNDPAVINQSVGKIENPDIADCYNTVLKISKKRSYVDATITATAASDIFTQDLEDLTGDHENGYDNNTASPNGNHGNNSQPENKIAPKKPQTDDVPGDQQSLINAIKLMLSKETPDCLPYFNDKEKEIWKKIVSSAQSLQELKTEYKNLKYQLEKREANYKPIPFSDAVETVQEEIPANASAHSIQEFIDDIPWGENGKPAVSSDKDLDIF